MNVKLVYPGERPRFLITLVLALLVWLGLIAFTSGLALLYVLSFVVFYLFAQSGFISFLRGSAVKITPEQFPDLHARVEACAARVGVQPVPETYLLHADGLFNALATRFLGRNFIVLFTSVVDALDSRPEALDFYIGHELGHIHRKHLVWAPVLMPAVWLPLLGTALRRAEEYTCDRYGLAACTSAEDAKIGMAALAAGHSRWSRFNYTAYASQRHEVRGFWGSLHEYASDYPWTAKRAFAIDELADGREPKQPSRNVLAAILACFMPRMPGAGGSGGLIMLALVIGILAAIAVPAYQDYVKRSVIVALPAHFVAGKAAIEKFSTESGEWPSSLDELGLAETEFALSSKVSVSVELGEQGVLSYSLDGGGFTDDVVLLTPTPIVDNDVITSFEWTCSSTDLKPATLPPGCR
ncbi:M48 family metalloprotease [Nevskia sp.]|uniref:M48 family metalloprotease n=1 Tax=Nevskia sp. TaxID=1929292 RepID=UPI0025FD65A3|nr:M48 family metalloprotease [Nevskia sp.]